MSRTNLKPLAAATLAVGLLAGTGLSAQEQAAPQAKPDAGTAAAPQGMGGGMMGQGGTTGQGNMMGQDGTMGMMAQMQRMMEGCNKMMQAAAEPADKPTGDAPQPRG